MADLVTELVLGDLPAQADLGFGELVSDAALARAERCGDPLADDVMARLARRRPSHPGDDVLAEVRFLAEVEGGVFRELLEACCYVPAWADFAAMEPGLHLVARAAPLSLARSDAEPADRPEPAQELAQRLSDTGTDLLLLPLPGEVQPGGRHHSIVTRLRLVNAALRCQLAEGGGDLTRRGVPLNQAHLATAVATFAYLTVAGMVRMGVPVSDDEIASTGLLWRWIGHVLGVDDDLIRLDSGAHVDRFRHLMAGEAARAHPAADALVAVEGALTALPRPLA
ncbi:MAG: oxygenase MpaB family protein, partial [Acidimicrobiia bacterium]|nr:oxygenase MpaB family protein [Acidimicrobiia bacterium]